MRPEDDLAAAGDALAHLHVKDARATPEGWAYVPLGEGDVALERVMRRLAGAEVPLGVELPLRLSRRRGGAPERLRPPLELAEIRRAVRISLDRLNRWRRAAEATRAGEEPPIPGSR